MISAWEPPVRWVWPRPSACPLADAMTQPTLGFGLETINASSAWLIAKPSIATRVCPLCLTNRSPPWTVSGESLLGMTILPSNQRQTTSHLQLT